MPRVTRVAHWVRCLILVTVSGPGCGGEIALNGLAPVDAGPTEDATNDMRSVATPPPDAPVPTDDSPVKIGEGDNPELTMCGPTNCAGCCNDAGACQSGAALNECGLGGGRCVACANGTYCSVGACQPLTAPPPCGPSTCPGCCDSNGTCDDGQFAVACGKGGNSCSACDARAVCTDGTCVSDFDAGPCVASSCPHCIPAYQVQCCKADQTCGCQVILNSDGGNPCQ